MLNAWILWWNAEALGHGLIDYWDAPIFFPAQGALALNEPQPAFLFLAPFRYAFESPIPAYNLYLLVTLTLNGWFTAQLLTKLKASRIIAIAGGIAMLLHPLLWQNIEAIQLTVLWPIVGSISAATALVKRQQGQTDDTADSTTAPYLPGVWLGLSLAITGWTCLYWFLFTLMTLGPTVLGVAILHRSHRQVAQLALAAGVCCILMLPIYLPMQRFAELHGLTRSTELVQALSAEPVDWMATSGKSIWNPAVAENNIALSPGLGRILLCLAGLLALCIPAPESNYARRQAVLLLAGTLTLGVLFSFGSNLSIGNWNLWEALGSMIGVIRSVRSPFRFAYLVQLTVILLAAISADQLARRVGRKRQQNGLTYRPAASFVAAIALAAVLVFDTLPERTLLCFPPSASHPEPWRSFIMSNVQNGDAILCLPVAADNTEASLERAARWMMHATAHGVPLANGYSGFSPRAWRALRGRLRRGEYSQELLSTLASNRISHLVVRLDQVSREHLETLHALKGTKVAYQDSRYEVIQLVE